VCVIMCYIIFYGGSNNKGAMHHFLCRFLLIFLRSFFIVKCIKRNIATPRAGEPPPLLAPYCNHYVSRLFVFNLVLMPSSIIVKIITLNVNAKERKNARNERALTHMPQYRERNIYQFGYFDIFKYFYFTNY